MLLLNVSGVQTRHTPYSLESVKYFSVPIFIDMFQTTFPFKVQYKFLTISVKISGLHVTFQFSIRKTFQFSIRKHNGISYDISVISLEKLSKSSFEFT